MVRHTLLLHLGQIKAGGKARGSLQINKPKMAYSRDLSNGLSSTVIDFHIDYILHVA